MQPTNESRTKVAAVRIVPRTPDDAERRGHGPAFRADYAALLMNSAVMRGIKEIIDEVADSSATVLIRGESGVGKDVIARAIPAASKRPDQPFVKLNCAALPAELLESELFGHERGAFTGAYQRKLGKFEYANGGTLFLDEIGELPLGLQAKLLHVLQDCEFFRIGGRELIHVDTRVIASTNRNLEAALTTGHFREDLYYRLNVVEIHVPALRERKEEIPGLVRHFIDKYRSQAKKEVLVTPEVMQLFVDYDWPGNVRELENLVRRLTVLGHVPNLYDSILGFLTSARSRRRTPEPPGVEEKPSVEPVAAAIRAPRSTPEDRPGLKEIARQAAREAEARALLEVLNRVRWNRLEAARLLKISYKTLLAKISACGLDAT